MSAESAAPGLELFGAGRGLGELGRYSGPRNMEEVLAGGDPPCQAKVVECLRQGQRRKVVREGGLLGHGDQGVQPHQVVIDGLDLRVRREPRVGKVPGPLIVLLVHAEPRRWLPAQHAEELVGAEFGPAAMLTVLVKSSPGTFSSTV